MTLTLHVIAKTGSGPDLRNWQRVVQYEVKGLPKGEEAWIGETHGNWRLLRSSNAVMGNWTGEYNSAEEALKALEGMLNQRT